ncbi:hypothetical protein ACSHWB_21850 [Lentzea sp. HUAS TT2]|uniref:hypothetical protein n=1 Tax=Lentzea sp. HUAS TT2 TaxID=3447454 RepID=UPI003F6FA681
MEGALGSLHEVTHQRRQQNVRHAHQRAEGLYADEATTALEVINTLAKKDQDAGRKLRGLMRTLVRAAASSTWCLLMLRMLRDHPQWEIVRQTGRAARQPVPDDDQKTEKFDHNRALLSRRNLLWIEIALSVAEFFFWYTTFTVDLDRRAELLHPHRIAAILMAVLIPVVTIMGARLAGGLAHRWVMEYQGISKRRHFGAAVGLGVFLILLTAIFLLVLYRFDSANTAIGSVSIPALPMAMIFAGVLLTDAAVRTYLVSEVRDQYRLRSNEFSKLAKKFIESNRRHQTAWLALRLEVQHRLNEATRVNAAGARLVTQAEAYWGDPHAVKAVPEGPAALVSPDQDSDQKTSARGCLLLPNLKSPRLFGGVEALLHARSLADMADLLLRCRAWDAEDLSSLLDDLWNALHEEEPGAQPPFQSGTPSLKVS